MSYTAPAFGHAGLVFGTTPMSQVPGHNLGRIRSTAHEYRHMQGILSDPRASDYYADTKYIESLVTKIAITQDWTTGSSLSYMAAAYELGGWGNAAADGTIMITRYSIFSYRGVDRHFHGYGTNEEFQEATIEAYRNSEAEDTRVIEIDWLYRAGNAADYAHLMDKYRRLCAQKIAISVQAVYDKILADSNAIHLWRAEDLHQLIAKWRWPGHTGFDNLEPEHRRTAHAIATLTAFKGIGSINRGMFTQCVEYLAQAKEQHLGESYAEGFGHIVTVPIHMMRVLENNREAIEYRQSAEARRTLSANLARILDVRQFPMNEHELPLAVEKDGGRGFIASIAKDVSSNLRSKGVKTYHLDSGGTSARDFAVPIPSIMKDQSDGRPGMREFLNVQADANLIIYDTIRAIQGDDGAAAPGNATLYDFSSGQGARAVGLNVGSIVGNTSMIDPETQRISFRAHGTGDVSRYLNARETTLQSSETFKVLYKETFSPRDPVLRQTVGHGHNGQGCLTLMEWIAYVCAIAAIETSNVVPGSGKRDCHTYMTELIAALNTSPLLKNSSKIHKALALQGDMDDASDITKIAPGTLQQMLENADDDTRPAVEQLIREVMFLSAATNITATSDDNDVALAAASCDHRLVRELLASDAHMQMLGKTAVARDNDARTPFRHYNMGPLTDDEFAAGTNPVSFAKTLARNLVTQYLVDVPDGSAKAGFIADEAAEIMRELTNTTYWDYAQHLFSRGMSVSSIQGMLHARLPVPFDVSIIRRLACSASHAIVSTAGTVFLTLAPFQNATSRNVDDKSQRMQIKTRFFPWSLPEHTHLVPGAGITDIRGGSTRWFENVYQFFASFATRPGRNHGVPFMFLPGYGLEGAIDSSVGYVFDWEQYHCHAPFVDCQNNVFRTPYYAQAYLATVRAAARQKDAHPFFNKSTWNGGAREIVPSQVYTNISNSRVVPLVAMQGTSFRGILESTAINQNMRFGPGTYAVTETLPVSSPGNATTAEGLQTMHITNGSLLASST